MTTSVQSTLRRSPVHTYITGTLLLGLYVGGSLLASVPVWIGGCLVAAALAIVEFAHRVIPVWSQIRKQDMLSVLLFPSSIVLAAGSASLLFLWPGGTPLLLLVGLGVLVTCAVSQLAERQLSRGIATSATERWLVRWVLPIGFTAGVLLHAAVWVNGFTELGLAIEGVIALLGVPVMTALSVSSATPSVRFLRISDVSLVRLIEPWVLPLAWTGMVYSVFDVFIR